MKRWISILAIPIASFAQQQIRLMPADARPSFEVATIKPSPPGALGGGSGVSPSGRYTAHNQSLRDLMLFAWGFIRGRSKAARRGSQRINSISLPSPTPKARPTNSSS